MEAMNLVATAIPGLHTQPTLSHMRDSCQLYNQLGDDAAQPEVTDDDLNDLARIFVRHNVQDRFGVHLIHSHCKLDTNSIMLGSYVPELAGCWTEPVALDHVDPSSIHGHIFSLTDSGFVAYEYRMGPPCDAIEGRTDFFDDLAQHLRSKKLDGVLGLQALGNDPDEGSLEFVIGHGVGTFMLKESKAAAHNSTYRVTGWRFEEKGGIISCKGHESHVETRAGLHYIFTDGKLRAESEGYDVLKSLLVDAGVYV